MTITAPERQARRAALSGMIGAAGEYYDFFIYGLAASLVFGKLFFPPGNPVVSTLLSLSTFAIGFLVRPISGAIFGHFGDRIGRKPMLVISLLMMAIGTMAVGVLPTYSQIGIAAPTVFVASAAALVVLPFVWFSLLQTKNYALMLVGFVLLILPYCASVAAQPTLFASAFPISLRFSGVGIGFTLGTVLGAGIAPLVASALFSATHTWLWIAVYMGGASVLSVIAGLSLRQQPPDPDISEFGDELALAGSPMR